MKLIATVMISAFVFFTMSSILPTQEDFELYDSCVRLHVLANSDNEKDQSLKLKIRDELLKEVNSLEISSKSDALGKIEENKAHLVKIAEDVAEKEGFDYEVSIEACQEFYPTRYYDDFSLPAGKYTSIKVKIGEGSGQNWWCVLYPPLCTQGAIAYDEEACLEVGLTKNQYDLITANKSGEYKIKFKILEIAAEAFGIDYD